jgi:hypothetical protein
MLSHKLGGQQGVEPDVSSDVIHHLGITYFAVEDPSILTFVAVPEVRQTARIQNPFPDSRPSLNKRDDQVASNDRAQGACEVF